MTPNANASYENVVRNIVTYAGNGSGEDVNRRIWRVRSRPSALSEGARTSCIRNDRGEEIREQPIGTTAQPESNGQSSDAQGNGTEVEELNTGVHETGTDPSIGLQLALYVPAEITTPIKCGDMVKQCFHNVHCLYSFARQFGCMAKLSKTFATKFGTDLANFVIGKMSVRGDPAFVRAACEASLKRLQVDCIDLYYQHRVDTGVPIEVTIGELKKLVEEGRIKYIGLSEASASTIRRAHAVHPITAVQLEWSLWTRDVEEEIVPVCRELGIGIVAYSPLGRGFLSSGAKLVENLSEGDFRKAPTELALAWVHHQGNDVCPIPGTTKIENLNQNIGALAVKLSPEEMAELEGLASEEAVKGGRYGAVSRTWKDSDTPELSSWKSE
ncbi:hypothetical protein IFM89_029192 [Coptis chinensis]|uniref:NADP-dependent oxidoreductase domain-containing protein n=1 Tax=Coptis chinensis TaxID=261450 RepID=A0A835ISP5_9MAGN|nr:hypothetical protein IFM89_029192 [Coptis chinensis]